MWDFTACCICVPQCLNLLEMSDCEQADGCARKGSLLSLRFERNIHLGRKTPPEIATFPLRCSATSNTLPPSPPPSALSIHTVPRHAGPGQDKRVQSLRRVNPQPIHNFLQECRTEATPAPVSHKGLAQERVHQASFCYRQGHQHHHHPPWKARSA